jgi:3',5'-cyclic AMP phosphodiesterase CpdA
MRTVVHLSDLHFGQVDRAILGALLEMIEGLEPHVVAVSGDLTQRARRYQFRQARAFLDSLPGNQILVPGNHDVPLYNVLARFVAPLRGFRRHISGNLNPAYFDEEIAVLGANTTRSFTINGGTFRQTDVRRISSILQRLGEPVVRILVGHHPFEQASPVGTRGGRASAPHAIEELVGCGVDVFLTGHMHVGYTGHTAARYSVGGRSAIVVEAGTAVSTRLRGEPNGFNLLRVERSRITIERRAWQGAAGFVPVDIQIFGRSPAGWVEQRRPNA